jgi:hypothetical protein
MILVDYKEVKTIVDESGFEGMIKNFEDKYQMGFHSCSKGWYYDPNFICRVYGEDKDLSIGFFGYQY